MYCTDSLDLSAVMATALHDIKNALTLFNQSIEAIANRTYTNESERQQELTHLREQSEQMSIMLTQTLAMYKNQGNKLAINIEEVFIRDLLDDVEARFHWLTKRRDITVDIICDEDLLWYCDNQLISYTLNDILSNALRFVKKNIQIIAKAADNQLEISILDDGVGFSSDIIESIKNTPQKPWESSKEHSGLGLFFAQLTAQAHHKADRHGEITLTNGGALGGGIFTLHLP
ncbi:sensor histidine kinase [Celerinatantimonas sp. MCCC 1A17872]|uniref:sensor histidine kinase n=1 Tax=Celerinatantimonas sp. MCCC 1A17872 TaxID=3177514 RepID=UPI0038C7ED4B